MSKLDLSFDKLGTPTKKPDVADAKRVAKAAGAAEGFTDRHIRTPVLRVPQVQINARVTEEFRERLMTAFNEEAAKDRALRSIGDFFTRLFEEWESRR